VIQQPALYTATVAMASQAASSARSSRSARAVSDDGALALVVRTPSEGGGEGGGTNAEQLFAADLAASFHGALTMVAQARGIALGGDVGIVASVHLRREAPEEGLCFTAEIEVALPAMERAQAHSLMCDAERLCPYARMARSGMRSNFILRYRDSALKAPGGR
jgi:osmotically inducible protein OsmC